MDIYFPLYLVYYEQDKSCLSLYDLDSLKGSKVFTRIQSVYSERDLYRIALGLVIGLPESMVKRARLLASTID